MDAMLRCLHFRDNAKIDDCIALGWRVVDWPLPIAATRTATRIWNRTGGSRDQRNHWEGTRAQGYPVNIRVFNPFPWKGR